MAKRSDEDPTPTQKTQPKKGKPISIPVPKRDEVERLISRAAVRKPREK
jgi:hypothetical protein